MSEQVRLNHSADDVDQMRKDWAESFHFDAHADLPGLLDDYDALHAEAKALRKRARTAEHEASQALRTLKGLEKVAKVVDANSDQVCEENNLLHQEVEALRAAVDLRDQALRAADQVTNAEISRLRTDLEAARGLLESFRRAAMPVIRLHLDNASVHPCDEQNDRVRANECSPEIRALYDALTATPAPMKERCGARLQR